MTVLPVSSRFSDLSVPTSSERVTRSNPPATLRDYLTPRQRRTAHFRIYAERTHTRTRFSLSFSISKTQNTSNHDHLASRVTENIVLPALIFVTKTKRTQSRRSRSLPYMSCKQIFFPFSLYSHWSPNSCR